jgi:hypothetical protein
LLDEHFTERRNHFGRIWRLLMFELWHRNFLEASPTLAAPSTDRVFAIREHSR